MDSVSRTTIGRQFAPIPGLLYNKEVNL